jgi:hypothetical protein
MSYSDTSHQPCQSRLSQQLTDATSSHSTSACSRTSATGSSAMTSGAPALASSAPNSSAIGTFPRSLALRSAAHLCGKGTSMIHVPSLRYWKRQKRNWPVNVTPDPYIRASDPPPSLRRSHITTAAAFPGGTKWYVALFPTSERRFIADFASFLCLGLVGDSQGTQFARVYCFNPCPSR